MKPTIDQMEREISILVRMLRAPELTDRQRAAFMRRIDRIADKIKLCKEESQCATGVTLMERGK